MDIKWHEDAGPHMKINETKGVTYLTFPALETLPGILHGFSTRLGGVSEGIYSSMNLSFTRGDREEAVQENFRRPGLFAGRYRGFQPDPYRQCEGYD